MMAGIMGYRLVLYDTTVTEEMEMHSADNGTLHQIKAPTLVIGGEKDLSLGGDASREIAAVIPDAELRMYEQWGHGLYEEAKDFDQVVLSFLIK